MTISFEQLIRSKASLLQKVLGCPLKASGQEAIKIASDVQILKRTLLGTISVPLALTSSLAVAQEQSLKQDTPIYRGKAVGNKQQAKSYLGGSEQILVKGSPADLASGYQANYENKKADLGPLGIGALAKQPFSVMEVPHDLIMNEQHRTMESTTEYMPSVQIESFKPPGAQLINRGFQGDEQENSRMDGFNVRISAPYTTELFQSTTVLNGIGGAMYGPLSPAGLYMMTLKRPTDSLLANFNFGYDSNSAPLESLDLSDRGFGQHMKWFGWRVNLMNQRGTSYVDNSYMHRDAISGNFDIHLTKKAVLELDAGQDTVGYYGLPGVFSYGEGIKLPNAPSARKEGYGQRDAGYTASTSFGDAKFKYQFNKDWGLRIGGLYESVARDVFIESNNIAADCKGVSGSCITQKIAGNTSNDQANIWSNYAYLNGKFKTSFITHHINVGASGYSVALHNPNAVDAPISAGKATGFYNPRVIGRFDHPMVRDGLHEASFQRQESLIVGDTMDFGKYVSVMGQFSWSWMTEDTYGYSKLNPGKGAVHRDPAKNSKYHDDAGFSPTVALMLHPTKNLNFYFTWARSLELGSVAPGGVANTGAVLAPARSEQFEGGVKWTVNKRLQLNLDGFSMKRPFAVVNPTNNMYGYYGDQKDTGIEFQGSGRVTKDLSVLGGFTWMQANLGNTGSSKSSNKQVTGVPTWAADVLLDYRLPKYVPGLAFNANVHYVGARMADLYNTTKADGYVTLNLGARYTHKIYGHRAVVRFGVDNVTGERYWASAFNSSNDGANGATNMATLGLPRMWHLTTSVYY